MNVSLYQSSKLLSRLKKLDRALDDYVASQFLRALVKVIGGYRDALRFKEQENGEVKHIPKYIGATGFIIV